MVIWVTGLAGAGKSTFATELITVLRKNLEGVVHLDGDHLRNILAEENPSSYSRGNRLKLAKIYTNLAKLLSDQHLIVVVSTISLFNEIHCWNRENIKKYVEIVLNPPLNILKKRDKKDLYSNSKKGTQTNVSGLDINVDFPQNPEFYFEKFNQNEVMVVVKKIIKTYQGDHIAN
jgi:adenylylsulfate kinase